MTIVSDMDKETIREVMRDLARRKRTATPAVVAACTAKSRTYWAEHKGQPRKRKIKV